MSSDNEKNISIESGWGPRLKTLRKNAGFSQTELAERSGLGAKSSGYISELENEIKIPGAGILFSISRVLETSMDFLMTGKGSGSFPGSEIIRATELVSLFIGVGSLTPTKTGQYIATVAELLVLGETESEIERRVAPGIRTLAGSAPGRERGP